MSNSATESDSESGGLESPGNSDRAAQSEQDRFFHHNLERSIHAGSYRASDHSVLINEHLSPAETALVQVHETLHAQLSLLHYGEMIRRIDHLGALGSIFLNLKRGLVVSDVFKRRNLEPFTASALADVDLRAAIRETLIADQNFVDGVRQIADLQSRKSLFESHWQLPQEGAAYWISTDVLKERPSPDERQNVELWEELEDLCQRERAVLLKSPSTEGVAYRLVDDLARLWGSKCLLHAVKACLGPDVTRINPLEDSIGALMYELEEGLLSPNSRLVRLVEIARRGGTAPRSDADAARLLDGEGAHILSAVDFNTWWDAFDHGSTLKSMLVSGYRAFPHLGTFNRSESEFVDQFLAQRGRNPVLFTEETAGTKEMFQHMPIFGSILNGFGDAGGSALPISEIQQGHSREREQDMKDVGKLIRDRDLFMSTMRREGIA